jgi:serine/threonine protein kinase
VARVIKQILSAIQYAAQKGVYHLDLKPENILLDHSSTNYDIKIVDFGLNKFMGQEDYLVYKLGQAKKGGTVSNFNNFINN